MNKLSFLSILYSYNLSINLKWLLKLNLKKNQQRKLIIPFFFSLFFIFFLFFFFIIYSEIGEETSSTLPYVRLSKRVPRPFPLTQTEIISSLPLQATSSSLLVVKQIINAFNAGDIETIHEIINNSTLETCEVNFSTIPISFVGPLALFSIWNSLFEAFPNGIFRTSDTVINEKKQVYTSFLFFGTKIFPLLIEVKTFEYFILNNIKRDGLLKEKENDQGQGGLSKEREMHNNSNILKSSELLNKINIEINKSNSFLTSKNPTNDSSSVDDLTINKDIKTMLEESNNMLVPSVKVDRDRPVFTTGELLEAETIPEMIFEGRIVIHLNETCHIRKFDITWNQKVC